MNTLVSFRSASPGFAGHFSVGVNNRVEALAYSLILGGALGNAFDRAVRGQVIDYLDFHVRGMHWPAFNVADMAITGGAVALVAASLLGYRDVKPASPGDT